MFCYKMQTSKLLGQVIFIDLKTFQSVINDILRNYTNSSLYLISMKHFTFKLHVKLNSSVVNVVIAVVQRYLFWIILTAMSLVLPWSESATSCLTIKPISVPLQNSTSGASFVRWMLCATLIQGSMAGKKQQGGYQLSEPQ